MKADLKSIECRACAISRPWSLVFLALFFLFVAVSFGCAKKYLQIVGTYQAEMGEIISIHYSYPNYYLQLLKQASESPLRLEACRPVSGGIEVFAPSSSSHLGTLIVPNSTFGEVTIHWKNRDPIHSTLTYRRTK